MILNDDAFARIVAEDVKRNSSQEQKAYIRDPEHAPRWRKALQLLLDNVDQQIVDLNLAEKDELSRFEQSPDYKKLAFEVKENYESRRSKIKRFRFHVEKNLAEADRIILLERDADAGLSTESFLRRAIETHEEMMKEYDLEPTPIDESLWESVLGRWTFSDIDPQDLE